MNYSSVNRSGVVPEKAGYDIMVTAATASFTANGVNIPGTQVFISNAPLLVTGSITNATTGTIFYYYEGDLT